MASQKVMRDIGAKSAHLLASNRWIHSKIWPGIIPHQLPSLVLILGRDVESIQVPKIFDAEISRQAAMTNLRNKSRQYSFLGIYKKLFLNDKGKWETSKDIMRQVEQVWSELVQAFTFISSVSTAERFMITACNENRLGLGNLQGHQRQNRLH